MSTSTQTSFAGFQEAAVQKIPSLAVIGKVSEVQDGKLSQSANYVVQPVKLEGSGAGRNATVFLLYRPEWLRAGFDPSSLEQYGDEGRSMTHVYRRNIAVKGGISTLKGLAGSDEGFGTLASQIIGLADNSIANVQNVLREFLTVTNEQVQIGYVLKQRKDKAGEDDNGKTIYELANGYEVGEFFFVNAENIKKLKQRAARSKGEFVLTFDPDEQ